MIESLHFYLILFVAVSPALLLIAVIGLVILMVPVYLYKTRLGNDKELEK